MKTLIFLLFLIAAHFVSVYSQAPDQTGSDECHDDELPTTNKPINDVTLVTGKPSTESPEEIDDDEPETGMAREERAQRRLKKWQAAEKKRLLKKQKKAKKRLEKKLKEQRKRLAKKQKERKRRIKEHFDDLYDDYDE